MTSTQEDLVNIALIVLRNRYRKDYLKSGGIDREASAILRSVASLIDCSDAQDIEIARQEIRRKYSE